MTWDQFLWIAAANLAGQATGFAVVFFCRRLHRFSRRAWAEAREHG